MALSYFGDKISDNMTMTPEGYLIAKNVKIGRTGYMEYLGSELPKDFNEDLDKICKVYRSPDELFSDATMASFEGKSVTNTHPTANLDVNTTPMTERGHMQNIRRDGDFLVGDLFIKDAGLISEVQNNLKREVSCGYDCSWSKIGDGKYEQKDIVGNHVAVVPNGRAGHKVAIQDSKPREKENKGGYKTMGNISKGFLTALGFKHFAQDAEPEDIAKAMDAMNAEEKEVKDAEAEKKEEPKEEPKKEPVKDDDETVPAWAKQLIEDVKSLKAGEKGEKKEADDAKSVLDAVEEDLDKKEETKDADPVEVVTDEDKAKEEKIEEDKKGKVADASLRKFVQDMKPLIMAIPNEKDRLNAAKKFASVVQDGKSCYNGYATILDTVSANRTHAMDAVAKQKLTLTEASAKSVEAWNKAAENMKNKGGK